MLNVSGQKLGRFRCDCEVQAGEPLEVGTVRRIWSTWAKPSQVGPRRRCDGVEMMLTG